MLTHLQITSAKPSVRPYNLPDSQGLYIRIQPDGGRKTLRLCA